MKVTADGLLGSAQKINNRKKNEDALLKQDAGSVKTDSVNLSRVINSRIEALGKEVRDIQTSLTKNQIIHDGIEQLGSARSDGDREAVLNETMYNNNRILKDFVGNNPSAADLELKKKEVKSLISNDIASLTKIQVEMDNIAASDIAGTKKIENLISGVNETLKKTPSGFDNISNLDAEKVMKLLR